MFKKSSNNNPEKDIIKLGFKRCIDNSNLYISSLYAKIEYYQKRKASTNNDKQIEKFNQEIMQLYKKIEEELETILELESHLS